MQRADASDDARRLRRKNAEMCRYVEKMEQYVETSNRRLEERMATIEMMETEAISLRSRVKALESGEEQRSMLQRRVSVLELENERLKEELDKMRRIEAELLSCLVKTNRQNELNTAEFQMARQKVKNIRLKEEERDRLWREHEVKEDTISAGRLRSAHDFGGLDQVNPHQGRSSEAQKWRTPTRSDSGEPHVIQATPCENLAFDSDEGQSLNSESESQSLISDHETGQVNLSRGRKRSSTNHESPPLRNAPVKKTSPTPRHAPVVSLKHPLRESQQANQPNPQKQVSTQKSKHEDPVRHIPKNQFAKTPMMSDNSTTIGKIANFSSSSSSNRNKSNSNNYKISSSSGGGDDGKRATRKQEHAQRSEPQRKKPKVSNKAGEPIYKYFEVVRKKKDREALPATTCKDCVEFYRVAYGDGPDGEKKIAEAIQNCSRHRHKHKPPSTPPHFWSIPTLTTPPNEHISSQE